MSEEIINVKVYPVKIEAKNFEDRKIELMEKLYEFLIKNIYRYCLVALPGFGKSTTILAFMLKHNFKFLYVASTKDTADQLALKCEEMGYTKPLVIHGNSNETFDKIPDQCITIYDHFSKFVDKHNPESMNDKICVVDECANLILHRDRKFRYNAIRKLELKLKYFKKIVFMSATPIDYRAYGPNLEVIQLQDDTPPNTLYAVPFGTNTETKDIAEICKHEISKGRQVVVYLQSLGEQLSEIKQYLKQLNINSISYYNSQEKVWKQELANGEIITEPMDVKGTSVVKGLVAITTYSDGISILNDGFSFIACSKADYHTVYQAMNRFRKGCAKYYVMSNAHENGADCSTVYDDCRQELLAEAEAIQIALEDEESIEEKLFYYNEHKVTLVNLEGEIDQAEIIRQTVIKQHHNFTKNYNGLKTAFKQYNVELKHLPRIPNRSELDYTPESKEKVLNGIFARLEAGEFIPNIHPEREYLDKIEQLQKYLSYEAVKTFMLTEFVNRASSYDEKLQQLQLGHNAKDALLKLRLLDALELDTRQYKAEELNAIVCMQCLAINYKLTRSVNSTLKGLGFNVKVSPIYQGMKEVWSDKEQKMVKRQNNVLAYKISLN